MSDEESNQVTVVCFQGFLAIVGYAFLTMDVSFEQEYRHDGRQLFW